MENLSHSRHPTRSKKACGNAAAAAKSLYDDVYGGPPKSAAARTNLSPRMEDYGEIFGSFQASRASSIPVLDLPAVDEAEVFFDVRSSAFDYSEVFGGFGDLDFELSYEDLRDQSKAGHGNSSDEAWSPAEFESMSDESDTSGKDHYFTNGGPQENFNGDTEFSISYHQARQLGNGDDSNETKQVAQIHAVPGFSYMVNSPSLGPDDDSLDLDFSADTAAKAKHLKKTKSNSFVGLSEISLRTQPSDLPPPSRPPPAAESKKGYPGKLISKNSSLALGGISGDLSPLFFDVEVDASSSAAVSAAAMKDAMEKAQVKLKSAKEIMEKKKGLQSSTKSSSKKSKKDKIAIKVADICDGEELFDHFESNDKDKHVKEWSSGGSYKIDEGSEWKEATEFFELVATDEPKIDFELARIKKTSPSGAAEPFQMQSVNSSKVETSREDYKLEVLDDERSAVKSKEEKEASKVKDRERHFKVTREVCDYRQNTKSSTMAEQLAETTNIGEADILIRAKESRSKSKKVIKQKEKEQKVDEIEEQLNLFHEKIRKEDRQRQARHENMSVKGFKEVPGAANETEVKMGLKQEGNEAYSKEILEKVESDKESGNLEGEKRCDGTHVRGEAKKMIESVGSDSEETKVNRVYSQPMPKKVLKQEETKQMIKKEAVDLQETQRLTKADGRAGIELKVDKGTYKCTDNGISESVEKVETPRVTACNDSQPEIDGNEIGYVDENDACEDIEIKLTEVNEKKSVAVSEDKQSNQKSVEQFNVQKERSRRMGETETLLKVEEERREEKQKIKKSTQQINSERVRRERDREIERARIIEEEKQRKQHSARVEKREEMENESVKREREIENERLRKIEEEREQERVRWEREIENERLRKIEEEREQERVRWEREMEKERLRKIEEEREQERLRKEREMENERLRMIEEEKEREREMESERLRKIEEDRERERLRREWEMENERLRKIEEEKDREREMETERLRKVEEEREQERVRRERELDNERLRKIEEERERERERREREIESERLRKIEEERERLKEIENERLRKIEEERERVKEMEYERLRKIEEERELERARREREMENERLKKIEEEREQDRLRREREMENDRLRKIEEERGREKVRREREIENERLRRIEEEKQKNQNLSRHEKREDTETERARREKEIEKERLREIEEEREREREREKDRMAVDLATLEARERVFGESRASLEKTAVERATAEARQRAMAEARERLEKACAEAREKSLAGKTAMEARIRAERAAVERATAEARERAAEKLMADRERVQRSVSDKFSASSRNSGMRQSSSSSDLQDNQSQTAGGPRYQYSSIYSERYEGGEGESAQRCKARLERHRRTSDRAAKALAEKNMRDLLAQREQAERNRLAETLDADVRRWSNGKEGNLRALLSTLQYILGSDNGWQPIPLTEVITSAAVKKAYRKATLCVHPDKLQQRDANIQQKYVCEKVFDLLKEAWNKFNSEER